MTNKICDTAKMTYAVILDIVMNKIRYFKVFDWAIAKTCIFSIGLLFGAKFSNKIKKFAPILIIITICSYAYILYKLFFENE